MFEGGDPLLPYIITRFSETGVGTSSGATVTHTNSELLTCCVTGIQVSGDAACIVTIESPASTVLWRKRFTAAFEKSESFPPGFLVGAAAKDVLVKISASTSNCEANLQGFGIATGTLADLGVAAVTP